MLLVSKLLALFVFPLSFFFTLVVVSIVLRRRLAHRSANALRLLAVAWLYFCATEWGASLLLAPLERGYPAVETDALPLAEAIVVLGGGMTDESRFGLGGDLNAAADRLWHSAALFSAGKAPIMVLSGGAALGQSTTEAELSTIIYQVGTSARSSRASRRRHAQRACTTGRGPPPVLT